mmetsp:Transcript_85022/g.230359  ORF Transcript_85022/g.230359 Transcript_85022/m.230359 type:complete len:222 (+) Transcript_85022:689-1354(+)
MRSRRTCWRGAARAPPPGRAPPAAPPRHQPRGQPRPRPPAGPRRAPRRAPARRRGRTPRPTRSPSPPGPAGAPRAPPPRGPTRTPTPPRAPSRTTHVFSRKSRARRPLLQREAARRRTAALCPPIGRPCSTKTTSATTTSTPPPRCRSGRCREREGATACARVACGLRCFLSPRPSSLSLSSLATPAYPRALHRRCRAWRVLACSAWRALPACCRPLAQEG